MNLNPINIFKFIYKVCDNLSEPTKLLLKVTVLQLEEKAEQTKNPYDDILVGILKMILFIKKDPEK